jgi:hypothetical protein
MAHCITHSHAASPHAKQVFKSHSLEGRCFRNHIRNPLDGARAGEGVASFHTTPGEVMGVQRGCVCVNHESRE